MKRAAIKKRPLSDTTLVSFKPEHEDYRGLNSNGLISLCKKEYILAINV